ncbi:hypothetical protein APHAL10511_004814 [Amanita phalloides]|nr:hypothetical protein APHAL10511_004814 [Amanita phalloides]
MGVHGLTTFLQENKHSLSKTFQSTQSAPTPVVVDGWSFIYKLYQDSNLPWVYGGEYAEFSDLVARTVQAWIDIGFEVYFVFDGPCPEIKFPTIATRRTQTQIHHSLLFFRTSASSRSTGRFLNETRIIPPLVSATCIQSLQSKARVSTALQVHFADEEGDPFAVELAGRIGGYVIGNDSDFVILNSECYKGYVPLDEMVWLLPESLDPDGNSDGEFRTIRKPKSKHIRGARAGKGIIPPDHNIQDLALSFCAYSPESLAAYLKIPVTLLPLLAAIVGNDFSSRSENPRHNAQSLFFERRLAPRQRIERAASIIHSILSPDPNKRRTKHLIGSVMDLIDRTVNTLLSRRTITLGSGEIEEIIDGIVNATLQYALTKNQGAADGKESLWPTDICALHGPDACPLLPVFSRLCEDDVGTQDEDSQAKIKQRGLYLEAYRKGLLSEKLVDIVNTASYWPRLFLENPDIETVGRSIGRPIRIWTYAILANSVGLPEKAMTQPEMSLLAASGQLSESIADENDNELVDVVEVNSEDEDVDLLAPLKGDLQRLHLPEHEDAGPEARPEPPSAVPKTVEKRASSAIFVTEHLRRGIRIAEEAINVTLLSDLLATIDLSFHSKEAIPLLLKPQTDALTVLLRAVGSDTPAVRSLKREQLTVALSLRWIIYTLHKRAEETGSKERAQERWSKREACCFLATFMWSDEATCNNEPMTIAEFPAALDRNVQLTAQILASLESINEFASVLLISDLIPPVFRHFSGKKFHAFLTGLIPLDATMPSPLWDVCQDGLQHRFLEEEKNIGKRLKKVNARPPLPVAAQKSSQASLFTLLGEGSA